MSYFTFVGQPGEFLTAGNGAGVPGRDLSPDDVAALDPEAKATLEQHVATVAHPIYEKHDGEPPAPKRHRKTADDEAEAESVPSEPEPLQVPTNVVVQQPTVTEPDDGKASPRS